MAELDPKNLTAPAPAEPPLAGPARLIAIAVGNTRSRVGVFHHAELKESASFPHDDAEGLVDRVRSWYATQAEDHDPVVVLASVRPSVSDALRASLGNTVGGNVYQVGSDLPIHINHLLDDEGAKTVGQDRLLCALGAFARTGQATVVVDAGTAVTVDFVDGEGTFCGGAIAPGLRMMLDALHEHAEQLPKVEYQALPEGQTFGGNTTDAIRLGVEAAIQGMVRHLTERYALSYGGYPQIVATGGDLGLLQHDDVIEHFVPDLQLLGIQVACARALAADNAHDD